MLAAPMGARGGSSRGFGLAACALLAGCAGRGTERDLAPFFSEHSMAGGGIESEALGGALRTRVTRCGDPLRNLAIRPIFNRERAADGNLVDRFLTPFGYASQAGEEYVWQLLPLARYDRSLTPEGAEEWTFFTILGIYWSRRADGRTLRGWFPFAGIMEGFLSYDRLEWVMFPLWLRTERSERVTNHVLWPFFSETHGQGGPSWRVWPLIGNSIYEGRYERWFLLWPFFLWQRNNLAGPPHTHETMWFIFPFFGETRAGAYRAYTALWPFFGWSADERTGFYAWDAPWPLVRVLRNPVEDVERTRVWPFWSNYRGDGLESTWWGWPFFNDRREVYESGEKESINLVPIVQSSERVDDEAGRTRFEKVWPLYRTESRGETESKSAFPALNPLWRTPEIDEMYAWMWELYFVEKSHGVVRERAWLGLWRREKDPFEERQTLSALWSWRRYRSAAGPVSETSLLFGLVRWRNGPDGSFGFLLPAIPGPGWPLEPERAGATVGPALLEAASAHAAPR
jgi:hypothetical protein